MKNVVRKTQDRIDELLKRKAQDLMNASLQAQTARAKLEKAQGAVETAAAALNADEYAAARAEVDKLKIELEMYDRKEQIIKCQDIVSEEESSQVIDSLLKYEEELTEAFQKDLRKALEPIEKMNEEYRGKISETEKVIRSWTQQIRANYDTRGTTTYTDEEGNRTSRSPVPVPVHMVAYTGCQESNDLTRLLPMLLRNK